MQIDRKRCGRVLSVGTAIPYVIVRPQLYSIDYSALVGHIGLGPSFVDQLVPVFNADIHAVFIVLTYVRDLHRSCQQSQWRNGSRVRYDATRL